MSAAGLATTAPVSAQPSGPTVTVEPASDLADGTRVSISVSGLRPHTFVEAVQCSAEGIEAFEDCDYLDSAFANADGSGAATLALAIDALLTPPFAAEEVDCRTSECQVVILSEDFEPIGTAPLHFDPDAALAPPPSLTVAPNEQLADFQTVEVGGAGLVWSDHAVVVQCVSAPANIDDCDFETVVDVAVDAGSFTADYAVSAVIDTGNGGPIDCREDGACVLAVSSGYSTSPAKSSVVPLSFDPGTELMVGTITVTPDTDLVDGQTVGVAGTGFRAGSGVSFYVCASDPPGESCQWTPNFAIADDAGAFDTDVVVSAVVPADNGEVDCRTPETCVLVGTAGSPSSPRADRTPLHFDPDAPLLPAPDIAVDPSTDLPDEATVTVSGSHFTPNGDVSVMVCRTGFDFLGCDPQAEAFVSPDGSGAFTTELGVAARFESWADEGIDCREEPGCEVVAEDWQRQRRATAPLTFAPLEPPGPSARRYLEPVFDEVEVTHRVVYRHAVDAHGNPVQLTLDVY